MNATRISFALTVRPGSRTIAATVLLTMCLCAVAVSPIGAQDAPRPPLSVTGNVAFVDASGNTDLTTLSGDERLEYKAAGSAWTFTQFALAVYGRTDGVTSANQLKLNGRVDRTITGRLAGFGGVGYERNRFAGISRRFEEIVGLAYTLIDQERDKLAFEAGAAFNQQRDLLGVTDAFVAARTAGAYKHFFTEAAFIQQLAELLPNLEAGEDVRLNTETSVVAPLSRRFGVKVAYAIRFDNLPEPGFRKTDRVFTSGLQVTF